MGSERRTTLLAISFALAISLGSPHAAAAPSEVDRETAIRLMHDGDALFRAGDYLAALGAYRSAHRIVRAPTTRVAVARAEEALGHLVEARSLARELTRETPRPDDPEPFLAARHEALGILTRVEPKVPTLVVLIEGAGPSTAKVEVDGTPLLPEEIGTPREVNPGKHVIRGTAEGHIDNVTQIDIPDGESRQVRIMFSQAPAPAKEPPSSPPPARTASPLVLAGFGAAAVGVTVGSVTGALAFLRAGAARSQCSGNSCPAGAQSDIDATHKLGTISTISFVAALGFAGVGIYGLLRPNAPTATARITPWVSPDRVGVAGEF